MTFQHPNTLATEHPLLVEYVELAAVAVHVKTVVADGFDNMSALKKPETAAASVTRALEHCSAQPSLDPTAAKFEQVAYGAVVAAEDVEAEGAVVAATE